MRPLLRGMLFDLDGTLADTDPLHFRAWRDTLGRHGVPLDEHGYHARISGRTNPDILRGFFPTMPPAELEALAHGKEVAYRALATDLAATNGLGQLLALCAARGLKVALVTNAPRENAEHVLEALGLGGVFEALVVAGDTPRGKPDPAPYLLGLTRLGLRAEEAVAFEDAPAGISAARAAGIRTVAIARAHPASVLREAGAELSVPDFAAAELGRFLESLGVTA